MSKFIPTIAPRGTQRRAKGTIKLSWTQRRYNICVLPILGIPSSGMESGQRRGHPPSKSARPGQRSSLSQ
eukprot:2779479-Pyramimonas_sp.AAC.1